MVSGAALAVAVSAFLATIPEAAEAAVIVAAASHEGGLRPAARGAALGVLAVAVLGAALGVPLYRFVPIDVIRALVGIYLFNFGLGWFSKAARRLSRSEAHSARSGTEEVEEREVDESEAAGLAFRGVFVEGVEIVLIVLSLAAGSRRVAAAVAGAALAALLVAAAAATVMGALRRLPEVLVKAAASVAMLSIGTFFAAEAAHLEIPGHELAVLPLALLYVLVLVGAVAAGRLRARSHPLRGTP
jgi:uncharacterized membrane protein